jgi:tRNA nucleotidyltransferase (CCA-adding enzyme)
MDIREEAIYIIKQLQFYHYQAYLVGGCVRDELMGRTPKDYDIVTNAPPNTITHLFRMEYQVIDVGKAFGITILHKSGSLNQFEVATFRKEEEFKDARHPDKIEYVKTVEEDLSRRDFSINAIALDPITGKYIDPFAGRVDIQNKKIQFVGEPKKRIEEDHLRIMRAIRFTAQLDFSFTRATYNAIKETIDTGNPLTGVSQERITQEFSKIMVSDKPSKTLNLMRELGILEIIIPEIKEIYDCPQDFRYHQEGDVWTHTLKVVDNIEPDLILRLSALFHDIGKKRCIQIKDE